ncbi:MAG: T9SS type A sorting domain-containing protein [Saprospiraceae bacterium]|nr:T9SS type A sorting domain-containing protein [Saprospiraceae bacterium]
MKSYLLPAMLCLATIPLLAQATLVKDINPGIGNGLSDFKEALIPFQGKLFFRADDGVNGEELWVSDGTTSGTMMLKDINAGSGSSAPDFFTVLNNKLFFMADDGAAGNELWVTDGTPDGTQLHFEFGLGIFGLDVSFMGVVNNHLIIKSVTGMGPVGKMWSGDANGENFVSLANVYNGIQPEVAASVTRLFFTDEEDNLRVSDGTVAGTSVVFEPLDFFNTYNPMTIIGDKLYFGYGQSIYGTEPWVSDGTPAGTFELNEFLPGGYDGGTPMFFTGYQDHVYFRANSQMWRTDGTVAGTFLFQNIDAFGGVNDFDKEGLVYNGKLYFLGNDGTNGSELWSTDGTSNGTTLFKSINDNFLNANPSLLTLGTDGNFYFVAYNNTSDYALWRSNGTANGTVKVADPYPGDNAEYIWAIVPVGNNLFFVTKSALEGQELWKLPITTVSAGEVFAELVTNLQPNPATDKLFLTCNFSGDVNVQLLDLQGRTLQSWQRNAVEGQTLNFNLNAHPTGLYLLQLNHEGNVQVLKTVIQK